MRRNAQPIPEAILDYLEPVKNYVSQDPIEKEDLIERCTGRVERPLLNFLKQFSFFEIRKTADDRLIVV